MGRHGRWRDKSRSRSPCVQNGRTLWISKQVAGFGRYAEKRPRGLRVDDAGSFAICNLVEVWGRRHGVDEDEILGAVNAHMLHDDRTGSLRFAVTSDQDGNITVRVMPKRSYPDKSAAQAVASDEVPVVSSPFASVPAVPPPGVAGGKQPSVPLSRPKQPVLATTAEKLDMALDELVDWRGKAAPDSKSTKSPKKHTDARATVVHLPDNDVEMQDLESTADSPAPDWMRRSPFAPAARQNPGVPARRKWDGPTHPVYNAKISSCATPAASRNALASDQPVLGQLSTTRQRLRSPARSGISDCSDSLFGSDDEREERSDTTGAVDLAAATPSVANCPVDLAAATPSVANAAGEPDATKLQSDAAGDTDAAKLLSGSTAGDGDAAAGRSSASGHADTQNALMEGAPALPGEPALPPGEHWKEYADTSQPGGKWYFYDGPLGKWACDGAKGQLHRLDDLDE